jgi:NADPH2:quinone reductase
MIPPMRAIRVHRYGGPEVLGLEDQAVPVPGPGQVRVRLQRIGVNFIDVYHRDGRYATPLPFTPGMEGAGTVDALGKGVRGLRAGDRVAWAMALGSYAEQAIVEAERLVPMPAGIDFTQAAAVMLQGMTVHYLATDTFPVQHGQLAVVHAAAGGVGLLLTQVCKRRGARVLGVVSNAAKAELVRQAGADEVLVGDAAGLAGRGADVVYDAVGRATLAHSLAALRPRGMLVLYGQASGFPPPLDLQALAKGALYLTRPGLAHYVATRDELMRRASDVFAWVASGSLRLRIDRELPLAQAGLAHSLLAGRQTAGKLLLVP